MLGQGCETQGWSRASWRGGETQRDTEHGVVETQKWEGRKSHTKNMVSQEVYRQGRKIRGLERQTQEREESKETHKEIKGEKRVRGKERPQENYRDEGDQ